jgi:plastocyanin
LKRTAGIFLVGALALTLTRPVFACIGDCDLDGQVSLVDLVHGVNIALGAAPVESCALLDENADDAIEVGELVAAVDGLIESCRAPYSGRYDGTIQIGDDTVPITFMVTADGQISGTATFPGDFGDAGGGAGTVPFGVSIGGGVNLATGEFSITGFYTDNNGQRVDISITGTLPIGGAPFSVNVNVGGVSYSGSIGFVAPTATPTRTPTPPSPDATVIVGQGLVFDPEVVEIDIGDTVEWRWVAGPHSVRSSNDSSPSEPNCAPNGIFDSGIKSAGTYSFTFTAPGTYEYHCAVAGHCQGFETGYVVVRDTPSPTPTRTPTQTPTVPTPTPTPTPEIVNGVSVQVLGNFAGTFKNQFGGEFPMHVVITSQAFQQVLLTDIDGLLFGVNSQTVLMAETPTRLALNDNLGRSVTLELAPNGHLTGVFLVDNGPGMTFTSTIDLTKQS